MNTTNTSPLPLDLLDRHQAAAILRVNPRTLDRWRTNGTGPQHYRLGRRVLYTLDTLRNWQDTNHTKETSK